MTVTRGNRQLRSFAIVGVQKENGCDTKFNDDSRLVGANPRSAAQKAFSRLCNLKRVKGKCTLIVTVEDTTRGYSKKGKKYTYKVDRRKLAKPIILQKGTNSEYKIKYAVSAKKASVRVNPKGKCGKTSGPMKRTTPRKNKQEEKKRRLSASKSKSKGVAGAGYRMLVKGRNTKKARKSKRNTARAANKMVRK
jgi:hypothetical protein